MYVDGLSVGEVGDVVLRDRRALANDGMFLVVVTVDKQTGNLIGKPEIVTRGFVAGADDPVIAGAAERVTQSIENPGDHISEVGLLKAQIKDGLSQYLYERTQAPADGLPGRGRGLSRGRPGSARDADRERPARRQPVAAGRADARRSRCRRTSRARWSALVLLVLGAVTLIALLLPDAGIFNALRRRASCGRSSARARGCWPMLLLVAGVVVERAPKVGNGWALAVVGGLIVFLGGLGLIHLLRGGGAGPSALRQGGGQRRQLAVAER